MAKATSSTTITMVRDAKSGQFVTIKGLGALKGKMTISDKVDLTKPISGRNPTGERTVRNGKSSPAANR